MNQSRVDARLPEQAALLQEILDRLESPRIESVSVRAHSWVVEEGVEPPTGDGDEIVVATTRGDGRASWDAGLLARAFVRRSQRLGLPEVVWLDHGDGGMSLEHIGPARAPLSPEAVERFRAEVETAAGAAVVQALAVVQPDGSAFVGAVRVDEPHAFLRRQSHTFFGALARWRSRCDGIYAEIGDGQATPVVRVGWFPDGGAAGIRRDVECCAPLLSMTRGVGREPVSCPVFGDVGR